LKPRTKKYTGALLFFFAILACFAVESSIFYRKARQDRKENAKGSGFDAAQHLNEFA